MIHLIGQRTLANLGPFSCTQCGLAVYDAGGAQLIDVSQFTADPATWCNGDGGDNPPCTPANVAAVQATIPPGA